MNRNNIFSKLIKSLKGLKNTLTLQINRLKSNKQIFRDIYQAKLWGNNKTKLSEFDSGTGSNPQYVDLYVQKISDYITKEQISSVIDIGCGDFRVGKKIIEQQPNLSYLGIEVVDELTRRNKYKHETRSIKFSTYDFTESHIPKEYFSYELCLVRQVFQHLSNRMISRMLDNLKPFNHAIITEHQANNPSKKNQDQVTSKNNRTESNGGIYLDSPPFDIAIQLILSVPVDEESSINTYLWIK